MDTALRMGFLFLPPQNFLRKTWMKKYCALYNASNNGIQRIELFENEDAFLKQSPAKIIPLTDCWKVTPLPQKNQSNVFEVRTKNNTYQFSADTFQEMSEWLVSLQAVAFNKVQPKPLLPSGPITEAKQEENLLYCSMAEPEIYSVRAISTEAMLRNNLVGDYQLLITSVNFSIAEECSQGRLGRIILTWPYRHIRRYGCSTENFSFEAGRKCSSGEGLFTFATNEGLKIFQSIDGHVSALKSSQSEGDVPNSPSVKDDKDNCFTSKDSLNCNELSSAWNINVSDQPFSLASVTNNDVTNHKSSFKSLPPFGKPPRKKSNAYNSTLDSTSKVNNLNIQDFSNQYAEIQKRSSPDFSSNKNLETFKGNSSISSLAEDRSSKLPIQSFSANSVSKVSNEKTELCPIMENVRISEVPNKSIKIRAHSDSDYENCGLESTAPSPRSTLITEHIYGKISRQSVPSNTGNIYGSIITNATAGANSSPLYCNIPHRKFSMGDVHRVEHTPDHFLKNDAEYAQVFKRNKNS